MKKIFTALITLILSACASNNKYTFYTLRLNPKDDLKLQLEKFVQDNQLKAVSVVTAVGSLTQYHLRFANIAEGKMKQGHFEIVSLVGTLSPHGSHLHMSVSDSEGKTIGGHLLDKNIIYTTLEITLVENHDQEFFREIDPIYGFKELKIKKR